MQSPGASPVGGRVANPTQIGNEQMHQAFNQLPAGHQDMIRQHPLVAGGHISPQAAYATMSRSIPKGQDFYEGLRQVATGGQKPGMSSAAASMATGASTPRALAMRQPSNIIGPMQGVAG